MAQSQQGHVHGPNCSHDHHNMQGTPSTQQMVNNPYQGHVHGPNCNHDHNDTARHHHGISGMQGMQQMMQGMGGNPYQDHVHGPNCNHGHQGMGGMPGIPGMSGMPGMGGMSGYNPYSMQGMAGMAGMGGYNPMGFHFREYQKPHITQEEKEQLKKQEILEDDDFTYVSYSGEEQMKLIQDLCAANLSEPYSVFTYRYFVNNWPYLTYLAMDKKSDDKNKKCVGLIVAQLKEKTNSGYIAMLVVDKLQRRKGLGTKLVNLSISKMIKLGGDYVMLETEIDNFGALKLYEKLGFIKDYKYRNYYLNGNGAFRLKLYLNKPPNSLQNNNRFQQFR